MFDMSSLDVDAVLASASASDLDLDWPKAKKLTKAQQAKLPTNSKTGNPSTRGLGRRIKKLTDGACVVRTKEGAVYIVPKA